MLESKELYELEVMMLDGQHKMISPQKFFDALRAQDVNFFTGVPDSLLKDFCAYVTDNAPKEKNIITANEGNSISLAAGHYLATGKPGLVYLQNSGLGNCVNPLTSLTDVDVYSIPLLLLIGWRGQPGVKDEPQHVKMGKITLPLLDTLHIPYEILDQGYEKTLEKAQHHFEKHNSPFAIVVRKGTFEKYKLQKKKETNYSLSREEAIHTIVPLLDKTDIVVSTTGKTSRELFELREKNLEGQRDFLTVGSMGHSSSIALGIALQKKNRTTYCFDGDGALLMHMGSLATVGELQLANFKHLVFHNFAHDSVGGQPTPTEYVDVISIAKACGYKHVATASSKEDLLQEMKKLKMADGPALLEIKVNKGSRKDLGRPTTTPEQNKQTFMEFLK